MITKTLTRARTDVDGPSRRMLYRRGKRMLLRLLAPRWRGPRRALEPAVRRFLEPLSRRDLSSLVVGDRRVAAAAAMVLLGCGSAVASPPVELSDVAAGNGGFVINGIDASDHSGFGISGAGDVNGDGLADVIIGAESGDPGGVSNAGESYVVFGKAGTASVELSIVAAGGGGGFVMNGINPDDNSGISVSGAGDVNGDGLADLIVGAWTADPGGDSNAGESYVVFGKADTGPVELANVAAGSGGFIINGIDPVDVSGASVAGAGDVNGDGLDDVIVGAVLADPNGNSTAGESYVVFGKADTAAVDLTVVASGAAGAGGFVINGIDADDWSGWSVSDAGDVNGDGLADLIVGAPNGDPGGDSSAGESYVVFGKADTAAVDLAVVGGGLGGFVITGIEPLDSSGYSVSGAGDVNGDGLADLIIGADNADPGGLNSAGQSYVVFGKADTAAVDLAVVVAGAGGAGGFVVNGIDTNDAAGVSVSGAGDVNGDGLADVIVGAWTADPGGDSQAGESYVVFGKVGTAPVELADIAAGAGGFVINGIDAGDLSGLSVSGAGDVNGDGLPDLLIGASRADPDGQSMAGETYVVFAPVPCLGDFDGSGDTGFDDLTQILLHWGPCPPACPWDIDGSGDVGFGDQKQILLDWGLCAR